MKDRNEKRGKIFESHVQNKIFQLLQYRYRLTAFKNKLIYTEVGDTEIDLLTVINNVAIAWEITTSESSTYKKDLDKRVKRLKHWNRDVIILLIVPESEVVDRIKQRYQQSVTEVLSLYQLRPFVLNQLQDYLSVED